MIIGEASDETELLEFTIEPFVTSGYLLTIRYRSNRAQNITGCGSLAHRRESEKHRTGDGQQTAPRDRNKMREDRERI
jgi:hypothetical protein